MIVTRTCLLLALCLGISLASSDLDLTDNAIFDKIYPCFANQGDLSSCDLYKKQIDCLSPLAGDRFVDEILEGFHTSATILGCQDSNSVEEVSQLDNHIESESETAALETEVKHHRERRMFKSPCQNYKHPRLDNACAIWMYNHYHLLNPGWQSCDSFTYKYEKPCGYYWAKCKKGNRNHHCCISVHCHGGLGL